MDVSHDNEFSGTRVTRSGTWESPITFETPKLGVYLTISSTAEAARVLLDHWPVAKGKALRKAKAACVMVLEGDGEARSYSADKDKPITLSSCQQQPADAVVHSPSTHSRPWQAPPSATHWSFSHSRSILR